MFQFVYELANSMERSPSREANSRSDSEEYSLLSSHNLATGPDPEPDECSPDRHILFLQYPCYCYPYIYAEVSQLSISLQVFRLKFMYVFLISSMRATFPAHSVHLHLIILLVFCEEYTSVGSSLCIFLHLPIASFSYIQVFSWVVYFYL
jgi:hypothetical protein